MAEQKKKAVAQAPKKAADKPAAHKTATKGGVPVIALIVAVVAALAVGVLVGKFALGGSIGTLSGKTSLTEQELDATVATYTYDGKTSNITAKEVLQASTGVEASKKEDGSYAFPAASAVLSYAQNQILNEAVKSEGIEVTDEDMTKYAEETLGNTDYAALATDYGLTEDEVKQIVRESTGVKKLYDKVVGEQAAAPEPEAPAAAEEGKEDEKNAEYGKYIVGLLGDEWDGEGNKWAREDGPYYTAMKDLDFSADSASYNQAMQAYYVAYQQYSQVATTANSQWTDYVNGLMAKGSINIGELVS